MIIKSFLTGSIASAIFLAPEPVAGSGGAPKLTLEEQLGKARSDLTAAEASGNAAKGQVNALTIERDQLKSQFEELTKTATQSKADLAAAQSQVTTLTGERDTAKADLTKAQSNVTRLESLCSVKGIDSAKAVTAETTTGGGDHVLDRWQKETSPTAKAQLWREHKTEIRAEADRRAAAQR